MSRSVNDVLAMVTGRSQPVEAISESAEAAKVNRPAVIDFMVPELQMEQEQVPEMDMVGLDEDITPAPVSLERPKIIDVLLESAGEVNRPQKEIETKTIKPVKSVTFEDAMDDVKKTKPKEGTTEDRYHSQSIVRESFSDRYLRKLPMNESNGNSDDEHLKAIHHTLQQHKDRVRYEGEHRGMHKWTVKGMPHSVHYYPNGGEGGKQSIISYGGKHKGKIVRFGGDMNRHRKNLLADLHKQIMDHPLHEDVQMSFRDKFLTESVEEDHTTDHPDYTIHKASYADGKWVMQSKSKDGWKTREHGLAEALGGKYTHRSKGYHLSGAQVKKFKALHKAGVDGRISLITKKGEFTHGGPRNVLSPEHIKELVKKHS